MALPINDTIPSISYTATAGQTSFAVPFEFFVVGDLVVANNGTVLTYAVSPASASEYSVTGAGVEGGGAITLGGSGASAADVIVIYRDIPIERTADYPTTGPLDVESINVEQSKHVAMMQQLERDTGRAARVPIGEAGLEIPSATERANLFLGFNDSGGFDVFPPPSLSLIEGTYVSVDSAAAAAALAPVNGDLIFLADGKASGWFEFTSSSQATSVAYDQAFGAFIPPDSDPTGASGAFVRIPNATINLEQGGTDRTAVISAYNRLTVGTTFNELRMSSQPTTVGLGEGRTPDRTAANLAAAEAAIGTYTDGDLVLTSDDSREYILTGGELLRSSTSAINGKVIRGAGKNTGLKLEANRPAGECLLHAGFSDAKIADMEFDGNNPSTQWPGYAGLQNNTNTALLVDLDGYGLVLDHVYVRFSGGDGMRIRGVVGAEYANLLNCTFNMGWGLIIERNSAMKIDLLWLEGNDTGGLLVKPPVTNPNDEGYYRRSGLRIDLIYDENGSVTAPTAQFGGSFNTRIGDAMIWASLRTSPDFVFVDNATNSGVFQANVGNVIGPTANISLKLDFSGQSLNNLVWRTPSFFSSTEMEHWTWTDAGKNNVCLWEFSPDAFVPGARTGDLSINAGSSNWANDDAEAGAAREEGSLHHPLLDYASTWTTGPSVLRVALSSTAKTISREINATLQISTAYWAIITGLAEAHQNIHIRLYDQPNNVYFNWMTGTWTAGGAEADDYGFWRTVHMDRRSLSYQIPFTNDATLRTGVRIQLRLVGSGDVVLGHAWFSTISDPALCAVAGGVSLGSHLNPRFTDAVRPAAAAQWEGLSGYSDTASVLQTCDGSSWV